MPVGKEKLGTVPDRFQGGVLLNLDDLVAVRGDDLPHPAGGDPFVNIIQRLVGGDVIQMDIHKRDSV